MGANGGVKSKIIEYVFYNLGITDMNGITNIDMPLNNDGPIWIDLEDGTTKSIMIVDCDIDPETGKRETKLE